MQLLNPLLLIGLSAVAIPIAIHIISRHRARVVPFGSIVFLEESVRERVGIKRLQELLTLLLRCLLILFLVLAASKPLLKRSKGSILGAGSETDVVIILDNSCSMGYREGDEARFERARSLAEGVIGSLAANDRAIVLTSKKAAGRQPSWDEALPENALKQLAEARPSHNSASFLFALATALDLMNSATGAIREIHVLSDFLATSLNEPEVLAKIRSARTHASLYAVSVASLRGQNTAVAEVSLLEPYPLAGRPVTIQTRLHNHGDKPTTETVVLTIDGIRRTKREIRLESGQSQSLSFHHVFEEPGRRRVEVSLQDEDPLVADNRGHLPIIIHDAMPILVVEGGDLDLGPHSETFFLKTALTPAGDGARAALRPRVISTDELARERLDSYPIIMLANVAGIEGDALKALQSAVSKGSNVVIFLGERVRPSSSLYASSPLFPVRLGQRRAAPAGPADEFAVQVTQFAHPLFRRFRRGESGDFSRIRFSQYWSLLTEGEGSPVAAPAKFGTGDPAIVEATCGRGRVVIFASKCDADWSDFPRRPTYLPFIQQLVDYLSPARGSGERLAVGQPLPFAFDFQDARVPIAIRKPDETTVRLVASGMDRAEAVFHETIDPGLYFVDIYRPDGLKEGVFAVNVDPSESDLTPASEELLNDLVPGRTTLITQADNLPELLKRQREGVELWGNLLVLVLLLALVECYFANRSTPVG